MDIPAKGELAAFAILPKRPPMVSLMAMVLPVMLMLPEAPAAP
jgi:hypothetical protein